MKFWLFLFFPLFLFSQNTVQGIVSDENGNPIENVLVKKISNPNIHIHTDISGNFSLENVTLGDSLQFSHPYFDFKSVKLETLNIQNIVLDKKSFQIKEVTIANNLKNLNVISKIDLQLQPVTSSQDLLRKVPGLFIGQHAGGGKAEQIFLRGFDADHGTDVAISVDGMPVNMVSHAHGQGYADLHFLIPETIESIDFDKGSYFADKGDFNTAGYVSFKTKDFLDKNTLGLEIGQFHTVRTNGMFNLLNKNSQSAYLVGEFLMTDNYFDAPQNFNRINLFGKYTFKVSDKDRISVSLSHFKSQWDASGQIPERAVKSGMISHFGAIDSTEGGNTGRSNFNLQYDKKLNDHSFIKNTVYISKYNFELFSNFTFFLKDPVNGDQIKQKENRTLLGFQSEYNEKINPVWSYKIALGARNDDNKNVELSHTKNRQTVLQYLSLGDVNQTNLFSYGSLDFTSGKWLINLGLRADYFKFNYINKLASVYSTQSENKLIFSPKLNFLYSFNPNFNTFLKLGKGFHSNDARVVVAEKGNAILPASYNADLGFVWKPFSKLLINTSLWYLFLEQEFVYVGDEAVVEPSGKTSRKGIDVGLRYQLNKWLFWNTDFTYTYARAIDKSVGSNYIPLAPKNTLVNGFLVKNLKNFSGGINMRYLGDRPANEDNSVIAKGYFVTDLSVHYQFRRVSIGVNIDNIFNTQWKETQFLTESRLQNESAGVEEIHYTAGTPFNARLILKFNF